MRTEEDQYRDGMSSKTASCARCLFFDHGERECHRHAPQPILSGIIPEERQDGTDLNTWWPKVHYEDWCGDFAAGDAGEFDGTNR